MYSYWSPAATLVVSVALFPSARQGFPFDAVRVAWWRLPPKPVVILQFQCSFCVSSCSLAWVFDSGIRVSAKCSTFILLSWRLCPLLLAPFSSSPLTFGGLGASTLPPKGTILAFREHQDGHEGVRDWICIVFGLITGHWGLTFRVRVFFSRSDFYRFLYAEI